MDFDQSLGKDPNTNAINTQVNTFKDAWFAKLYKQGVEFDSDLIGVIPEGEFKETAKAFIKEFPSGLSAKGAQMDSITRDIKSFGNALKDKNYLDSPFDKEKIDIPSNKKFVQSDLDELTQLNSQAPKIPGQSLTNNPDSAKPWERPPLFTNPREALDDVATTILQPDTAKNIVKALFISTLASTNLPMRLPKYTSLSTTLTLVMPSKYVMSNGVTLRTGGLHAVPSVCLDLTLATNKTVFLRLSFKPT